LTGSLDSTAILWDLKGNILQRFKGHTGIIRKVAFSPDGKTILTGSDDQTSRIWDLAGNTLQVLSGHTEYITSLAYSPDGKNILTASADKTFRLWDLNGNTLQKFTGAGYVYSFAFSPDGKKILTFSTDGISRIWDLSQNVYKTFSGHKNSVYRVAFSADGRTIITLSADQTVKLWDLNGNCLKTIKTTSNSVALSPDGKTILTGYLSAQLFDLDGNVLKTFFGQTKGILSVAFSPDGKTILTGSNDKTARFWDLNGNTLQIFSGHTDYVNSVSFSPDGKTILTGSNDKTARLWDLNGNTLQIFSGHTDYVNSVAFSPDGKTILTGSDDKTARLWDLHGNNLQILRGFKNAVNSVAFSPDGKKILIGSGDNTVRLINLKKPLNLFLKESGSEDLSAEQKLQYGIIKINEAINEPDVKSLFEGFEFCLSKAKLHDDNEAEYLNESNILFKKTYNSIADIKNRKLFISYGLDLFTLKPQKYIPDRIEEANKLFLSASTKDELKDSYDFYSEKCSYLDSSQITLKLPECLIEISRKLLPADTAARHTISNDLSGISWPLLQNRRFKTSLDAIELAVKADSTNQYAYTTLPLVLVLNNRFDEASKIYMKYSKKFPFPAFPKAYRLIYLEDIADLEKRGITHPDFQKVRELLNK
jgi:WD40 repeat protein